MFRNSHHAHLTLVAIAAVVLVASPVRGVDFVWSGGGVGDTWFDFENWTPYEFGPPDTNSTATISNGDHVFVDANFTGNDEVNALTISGGSSLRTNGFEAVVHDGVSATTLITGASSVLWVQPNNSGASLDAFDSDRLTVASGGSVFMEGGVLEVDLGILVISEGGVVRGYGSIDLEDSLDSTGVVLLNDGVLIADGGAAGLPVGGTLDIDVSDSDGRIDLDGNSGDGQVIIEQQSTLNIGAPLNDAHSDLISFEADSRLIMSDPWSADGNSTIEVDAETGSAGVPDIATISGGEFTSSGVVNVNSGTLIIEPTFNASGNVNVGGQGPDSTLQLDGTATLTGLLLNSGGGTASLTVNGNTTITQPTLDWDANGLNTTAIGPTGVLTLNVTQVDLNNDLYNATINNSGELNVNLTNPSDTWTMAGVLNMDTSTGATINAGNMIVTGEVNILDPAGTRVNAKLSGDIEFQSASTLNALNVELDLEGTLTSHGIVNLDDSVVTVLDNATVELNQPSVNFGVLRIRRNATFVANVVPFEGGFEGGDIQMSSNSRLTVDSPWILDGDSFFLVAADDFYGAATISGGELTNAGQIDVSSGTLVIDSEFSTSGGSITIGSFASGSGDAAILQLDNTAVITDLRIHEGIGDPRTLIVNGNTTVTQATLDWATATDHTTTVGPTGVLTLNLDEISADIYYGTINIGGELNVNLTNPLDTWTMDGVLNLDGGSLVVENRLNGSPMNMTGEMNVGDTKVGITADTTITASSTTNFAAPSSHLRMSGETSVLSGATFNGSGTLANIGDMHLADGADTASVAIENGGTLSVGDSAGLAHSGPFTNLGSGTFVVEIDGTTLGTDYDSLDVDGLASLAGTLEVVIDPMFDPLPGDAFTILTYASHSGEFASLTGDNIFGPGGEFFHPVYQANRLLLYVPIAGDGNFDGAVDGFDYLLWAANFGDDPAADPPGPPTNGDFNYDNVVDGFDYLVWAAHFGETSSGFAVAVPEPGSFLLLAIATAASLPLRRKHRKHN